MEPRERIHALIATTLVLLLAPIAAADAEPTTTGPQNDSAQPRAEDGQPMPYGSPDCIECSGPAPTDGETCMDGAHENERCDAEVQYLDGRGPEDCEYCRGETDQPVGTLPEPAPEAGVASDATNAAPAAGVAVALIGAAAAAPVLIARRR